MMLTILTECFSLISNCIRSSTNGQFSSIITIGIIRMSLLEGTLENNYKDDID